jgi:hypothetical protein
MCWQTDFGSIGARTWVDLKDLRPGQRRKFELEHAIAASAWVVILVGPDLRASRWQEAEWRVPLVHAWSSPECKELVMPTADSPVPPGHPFSAVFVGQFAQEALRPGAHTAAPMPPPWQAAAGDEYHRC